MKIQQLTISIILLLASFYCILYADNNNSVISGKITNQSGEPVPSVRILISELKQHSFTNSYGIYELKNIPYGKFNISFSRIGLAKIDTIININQSKISFNISMKETDVIMDDVVVTGTKSYKYIENLPIPTEIVTKNEIQENAYTKLDEVLSQQSGLTLTDEHGGRGAQIQGLESGYMLILLNGEPVSSRTGGVMDISKFAISNLNRVEIVKGPASSLYGSNAFAGVINLITEKPSKPLSLNISGRYGSHNSTDFTGETQFQLNNKIGMNLYLDRYSTDGFKLNPESIDKTIPNYELYTLNSELFYDISDKTTARLSGKFVSDVELNKFGVMQDSLNIINDKFENYETNLSFNLRHKFSNTYSLEARFYGNTFTTKNDYTYDRNSAPYDYYDFKQKTLKAEIQSTSLLGKHQIVGGFGINRDEVDAAEISTGTQFMNLLFGYLQDDWQVAENVDVIGSLRFDDNSAYPTHLSPKLAASWELLSGFTVRSSIGSGFKAPDFEELFLNWNNNIEGYSVLGTKYVAEGFKNLQDAGQIAQVLINPSNVKELVPEKSLSFNIGFNYHTKDVFETSVNLFRNNINDLIDFLPIAIKTNGLRLYSYINLQKIYTQGIEAHINLRPMKNVSLELTYQYLETADENVVDSIKAGKIGKIDAQGNFSKVQLSDYGGLLNRSKHSGAIRLLYEVPDWDLTASLRGRFRSQYGYADANGNLILDDPREYAPGYSMWYLTVSKKIYERFTLQAGIDNIFNLTNTKLNFATSGRTYFITINYNYLID